MTSIIYTVLCLFLVAALTKPLGVYIAKVFMNKKTFMDRILGLPERIIYKICCIDRTKEMTWVEYGISIVIFGFLGFFLMFLIVIFQDILPLNPQGFPAVEPVLAFNIAIGFVTNGDWQSYSGESALSSFSQTIGISTQNFISTATGFAILPALARGISRRQTKNIGNFYVDVVRGTLYILLPLSLVFAIFLAAQGVPQSMGKYKEYSPIEKSDTLKEESLLIPQGAIASQIAIRTVGSAGGGFFATNGAHPFENPTPLSNFMQIAAILLLPVSILYAFGHMIGDRRQGLALIATMSLIFIPSIAITVFYEQQPNPLFNEAVIDSSAGNMEGKEVRFGIDSSALRIVAATATSNGSSNSMLDSFSPLGTLAPIILTQFSEVIFGGIGSGLYNAMSFVIVTVFIGGLMVGRTPEYMGKKITAFDMKMASIAFIIPALVVLLGTAIAVSTEAGKAGIYNVGAQGFTEVMYAFSSAGNNDGGTFAGLNTNSNFYNIALALSMFFSRYFVMLAMLAVAGSFAGKNISPKNSGTLPTHTPLFVFLLTWVLITVGILTYVPSIVFGPVAEHFHLYGIAESNTISYGETGK